MNKEEVKLIVLTTLAEIAVHPTEKSNIASKIDTVCYEMSSQRANRRQAFLSVILFFTVGIFLSLACLSAQQSAVEPKHQGNAHSAAAKPWWEFWSAPVKTLAKTQSP